jgi:hypothetical protein
MLQYCSIVSWPGLADRWIACDLSRDILFTYRPGTNPSAFALVFSMAFFCVLALFMLPLGSILVAFLVKGSVAVLGLRLTGSTGKR